MGSLSTLYLQITWPSHILDQKSAQKGLNNGNAPKYGGHWRPLFTGRKGVTWPTFEILWPHWPLHTSGTVEARNFKFGMQIDYEGHLRNKIKIRSKTVWKRPRDLLFEFLDLLHISGTIASCRLSITGTNGIKCKTRLKGRWKVYVTHQVTHQVEASPVGPAQPLRVSSSTWPAFEILGPRSPYLENGWS